MIKEKECTSWANLIDILYEGSYDKDIKRYRSYFAFRGLSDLSYKLESSLMRMKNKKPEIEKCLLRNFTKYACSIEKQTHSNWYWLILGQHHGLPTRLLDWTFSPLIAAHFATCDTEKADIDGVIWGFDCRQYKDHILPSQLRKRLDKEPTNCFTLSILENEKELKDFNHFDELSNKLNNGNPFGIILEPPSFDSRIENQFAAFTILTDPATSFDDYLSPLEDCDLIKIKIPSEVKMEIRDKLDQSNITERILLPGFDGIASWLKRYYSPLNTKEIVNQQKKSK